MLFFVFTEIGPVTITTDPKKFQYELRELYVQVSEMENRVSLADFPHFWNLKEVIIPSGDSRHVMSHV